MAAGHVKQLDTIVVDDQSRLQHQQDRRI
jgi:hypothetical protein